MNTAAVICSACNGTGKKGSRACSRCEGFGHVIAWVTASGHEITNPEILAGLGAPR
jgi:DnaJ-class molecular chaperone